MFVVKSVGTSIELCCRYADEKMNELIAKVKQFINAIGRLAGALFFAALGLLIVVYAYNGVSDFYQKKKNEKYESIADWSADLKDIGLNAKAKTKLVDSYLHVQLELEGYPTYLTHPSSAQKNQNAEFVIKFVDDDKFELFERRVKVSQFTIRVDNQGKPAGLDYQFSNHLNVSTYAKFRSLNVSWTLVTSTPEAKQSSNRADSVDHCAPGISQSERFRRLALHGAIIKDTAANSYSVGNRALSFSYDGSVSHCR